MTDDRLKVCATCRHLHYEEIDYEPPYIDCTLNRAEWMAHDLEQRRAIIAAGDTTWKWIPEIRDPCHFDPPRWAPYWEVDHD